MQNLKYFIIQNRKKNPTYLNNLMILRNLKKLLNHNILQEIEDFNEFLS